MQADNNPEPQPSTVFVENEDVGSPMDLLPEEDCVVFSQLKNLKTFIATRTEYCAVTGLDESAIASIDQCHDRHGFPKSVRLTIDRAGNWILFKMITIYHEMCHSALRDEMYDCLLNLGISRGYFAWVGATTFVGTNGQREKQGDQTFAPRSRIPLDFPSLAIEVGVSERPRTSMLKADAEFWLFQSGGRCNTVLTVEVNRVMKYITLNVYIRETVPGRRTHLTPNPAPIEAMVKAQPKIVIQNGGGSIGPPDIRIPLTDLFDPNTLPQGVVGDVVLTAAALQRVYEEIFMFHP